MIPAEILIQDVIHRLQPLLGRQKLLNLLFLIDYNAYKVFGTPLTNAEYVLLKNGIYSKDIIATLYELVATRQVIEIQLKSEFAYYAPNPNVEYHDAIDLLIKQTLSDYAPLPNDELTKIIKILFKKEKWCSP